MNNLSGANIVEIDLKKKKLEDEIMQLERELQKQDKKNHNQHAHRKDKSKLTTSPRDEKLLLSRNTLRPAKEVRPAISETWKSLFRLDPQLHTPEAVRYFDKQEFKVQCLYTPQDRAVYAELRSDLPDQWQSAL